MSEENESGKFATITTLTQKDSDSCMVIVYDKNIVQVGNCCTIVTVNVNEDVIDWLEKNTGDNAAELDLIAGKAGICTILWNNRDTLEQRWRAEFKSELVEELTYLKKKLYKKIVYQRGEIVVDIVKEFYEKFEARLEKISPGCITTTFVILARDHKTAKAKTESIKNQLEIRLRAILESDVDDSEVQICFNATKVTLRELYRNCKGETTSVADIESTADRLYNKVRDPGIYTLLCLDTAGVSSNSELRGNLQKLYISILKELDDAHRDDCVTFNEFVSLIAFGENEKIHIEQPFLIDFPEEKSFEHIIDAVHGSGSLLDVSKMLSILFQIVSKYGRSFHKGGIDIQPRIVILSNGKLKESELLIDTISIDTRGVTYPITIVPIDENCNEGLLKKLRSKFGGEITKDVRFVSHYVKYQQMIIDALKMGKRNNNEILETIKEHTPDVVSDIVKVLKAANTSIEKSPRSEIEAVEQEFTY